MDQPRWVISNNITVVFADTACARCRKKKNQILYIIKHRAGRAVKVSVLRQTLVSRQKTGWGGSDLITLFRAPKYADLISRAEAGVHKGATRKKERETERETSHMDNGRAVSRRDKNSWPAWKWSPRESSFNPHSACQTVARRDSNQVCYNIFAQCVSARYCRRACAPRHPANEY